MTTGISEPLSGATGDARAVEGQRDLDDLGPLSLFGCRLFLLIAPFGLLGALVTGPFPARVLVAVPALAAAAVAPRKFLMRIQVSVSLFLLVAWTCMSYMWSIDQADTLRTLREEFGPLVGLILVAGMLPVEETMKWFVRGMKLLLLVSLIGLLADPSTRLSVTEGVEEEAWRAWFLSKNQFGRNIVLAFLSFLVWDRTVWSRRVWIVIALVMVVGSSSAAALASAIVAIGLVFWVRRYQAVGDKWSGSFALASIAAAIGAAVAAFGSAAWLVGVLGRDLTFTGRTQIWTAVIEAVAREPIFGYGYGGTLFGGPLAESRAIQREIGFAAANAHSGPLQVAADVGLVGLALFFVFYLTTMTLAVRHLRSGVVAVWAFVFLWMQLLVGAVEPVFMRDWLPPLVLAWVLLARQATEERRALQGRDGGLHPMQDYGRPAVDLDRDPLNLGAGPP